MLKSFLVTGGSGFIGSHFIDLLLSKNIKVINVDLKKNTLIKKNKNYKFKKGNICDYKLINKIINRKIDCIFNLLEVIRKKKIDPLFVQISTDEVFGSLTKKQKSFNENSTIKPNSPYSASKASADHLVRSYNKTFNLKTIITHSSNNFGERQHPEKLIPLSIMQLLQGKKIPVYGDGKNIRDWIYVKDNCKCVYEIIKKSEYGKSYLVGANNEISNIDIVKSILKIFKTVSNINIQNKGYHFVDDRKGHDFRYSLENKQLIKLIGIKFSNFEQNLKKTINHYIKYNKFYQKNLKEKWLKEKIKNY